MGNKFTIRQIPLEAFMWLGGLVFLAVFSGESAWSVCPLHNLGIDFCPGCGLGRSVSLIFHGEWSKAWQMHPLGFVAIPVLILRSIQLIRMSIFNNNNHHGKSTQPVTGN